MPRRRSGNNSGERNARRNARSQPAPPADIFNDDWLRELTEIPDARYVDLGSETDRRTYAPDNLKGMARGGVVRKELRFRPRIVIVPEGHPLARKQTYGGRYSLRAIKQGWKVRRRSVPHFLRKYMPHEWGYGNTTVYGRSSDELSRRVGFALPWQVVICVRRKRRREVMFALKKTSKGSGAKNRRRDEYSDVRC